MKHYSTFSFVPIIFGLFLIVGLLGLFWYGNPDKAQAQDETISSTAPSNTTGSAFTYQGYLQQSGAPVDGVACDFYFALWTEITGGTQYGTQTINGVNVNDGVFTVQIDIGNVFTGDEVWLETAVQCPGDGGFTTLTPRQPLTAAPYALGLQPGAVMDSTESVGLSVYANDAPGQIALYGEADQTDSVAIYGNSENNTAVFGNSGTGRGVWGQSVDDEGVYGYSVNNDGVSGKTYGDNRAGVLGIAEGANGSGLEGISSGSNGAGVLGIAHGTNSSGLEGVSLVSDGSGVFGYNTTPSGIGVKGHAYHTDGIGVRGQADNVGGVGVYGSSEMNTGVYGESTNGRGVWGVSSADNIAGVYGVNEATTGIGVWGQANASDGVGVFGSSSSNTGVYGQSTVGVGVWGSGVDAGVYGTNGGSNTVGWAGYYYGRVIVNGTLQKAGGSFIIDHPLDPENMYLQHSFVESPDMMNVYNGNITLDEAGEAWVSLPDYFEALNRDFRYQLTAVSAPSPNLYIAATVKDNQFKIAGGTPGMTVSWQITGIRHDPWAESNRIEVELAKDEADQGLYLHPEAYGLPREDGIAAQFEISQPAATDQQLIIDN